MIFFIQKQIIIPTNIPRRGPPIETRTKLVTTAKAVVDSPFTKLRKSKKNTIDVPSFSKDSPSTNKLKWTLAPSSFNKATTATGSVAESTHPKAKASYQERSSYPYPRIALKMKEMMNAPHRTPGPAKRMILKSDFLKTCQSQLKAK